MQPSHRVAQLTAHRGERIELPGRYGPIAALHVPAPTGDAITVLLLPGYTGSKEDFAPLLDRIGDAGFEVIAVDLPGQYESPGPDDESAYLSDNLGGVFAEIVGKLTADGRRVLLLGHSYGGFVARAAVLSGAPVFGLTLLDTGPAALPDGSRRQLLEHGDPHLRTHGMVAVQELREQLAAQAPAWRQTPTELKRFLRERFLSSTKAGLLGMGHGLRTEPDRVNELGAVLRQRQLPCHIAAGEFDDAWPPELQHDMSARLGAPFTPVPGAHHSPNIEKPEALLHILLPRWQTWGVG